MASAVAEHTSVGTCRRSCCLSCVCGDAGVSYSGWLRVHTITQTPVCLLKNSNYESNSTKTESRSGLEINLILLTLLWDPPPKEKKTFSWNILWLTEQNTADSVEVDHWKSCNHTICSHFNERILYALISIILILDQTKSRQMPLIDASPLSLAFCTLENKREMVQSPEVSPPTANIDRGNKSCVWTCT